MRSTPADVPSHHRLSGILVFAPGLCWDVPAELAEAGRPAPQPLPFPGPVRARARGEGAVAAREEGGLGRAGGVGRILGEEALNELELFLFLLQEDVHQELLLPFELLHDGFGNVGDYPGHHQAEEHHQILEKTGRTEKTRENRIETGTFGSNRWMLCSSR